MTSSNPGGFTTNSDVLFGDDHYLYFQGTDNSVWRVNPMNPADNSNFGGPGHIAAKSNVVASRGYMFLRGTDDRVWSVKIDTKELDNLGGFTTYSDVLIGDDGYMYFRGTDNSVWRANPYDPADNSNFGGPGVIATQSNVVAVGGYMYFRGTDDKVWQVNIHNPDPNNPGRVNPLRLQGDPTGFATHSNVNCSGGIMSFQGTDNEVWLTDGVPYPNPSGYPDAISVPSAPRIYIQNTTDQDITNKRQIDNLVLGVSYQADFGGLHRLQTQPLAFTGVSTWGLNSAAGNGAGALQEKGSETLENIKRAMRQAPGGAWGDFSDHINPSITITKEDAAEISGLVVSASYTINGQQYNTAVTIGNFNQYYQLELNGGNLAITGQGPERELNPAFLRFIDILVAVAQFGAAVAGGIALLRTGEGGETAGGLNLRLIM